MGRAHPALRPASPQLGVAAQWHRSPVYHISSKMSHVCMVSLLLERPKAPRIYKANTLVASSYVKASESIYGHRAFTAKSSDFKFSETTVDYRLAGRAIELLPKLKETLHQCRQSFHLSSWSSLFTTSMSDKSKWKRKLPTRIYDYNFKVSEGYYAPQTEFIETRPLHRDKVTPPEHATYAERFVERPWYGGVKGLPYSERESVLNNPPIIRPRSASMSRLTTPTRTFQEDEEPISSRLSRGRSRLGSVSRLDDDDDEIYSRHDLQEFDVKEELRKINEQLHTAKVRPGLPVAPRSYVDTPRITQSEWRRRNKYLPLNDPPPSKYSSMENISPRPPLPACTSTIRKSSISIESQFEEKPPVSLRTRRASVGSVAFDDDENDDNDISSTIMRGRSRSRNISFSDSNDKPPRPPSTNRLIEENQRRHFNAQHT